MADWSKDNPHSIRGMRDADECEDADRARREKSPRRKNSDSFLGACILCGDARFTGNNRGEQPRCMDTIACQRRCRARR